MFEKQAPRTVRNFLGLAEGTKEWTNRSGEKVKKPFYNDLVFHRVIKGFMIQGGCPLGTGKGGPGFSFEDEIDAKTLGLDKMKVVKPDGRPHEYLGINSRDQWARQVVFPLCKKMGITNDDAMKARWDDVKKKLTSMTFKQCYENLGYKYSDGLKSSMPTKGVIAMANAGPNTNGSQFFINLVDTPHLAGKHTVFGKVVEGFELIEKVGEQEVGAGHKPTRPIKIISIQRIIKN